MKIINKVVHSIKEPDDHYVYWFDEKSHELKYFYEREGWIPIIETLEIVQNVKELKEDLKEFLENGNALDKIIKYDNE